MARDVGARDGAELCVETIGEGGDPALLLIAGSGCSMDWWEDELCALLAARGRRVIRYDHRDTGQSATSPPGAPAYTGAELATDPIAILDALGVERAHVAGLSMGGGIAQALALDHRDRLATLTLMSTSPIDPSIEGLPGPTPELLATFTADPPDVDWDDREAVVDHLVAINLPYGRFDEERLRVVAGRAAARTRDMAASLTNHDLVGGDGPADPRLERLSGLPTLVVHGTVDPLFPVEHGRALAAAVPGARLVELEGVGHQHPPAGHWPRFVDALAEHTAGGAAR